ncbi:hypothetical protein D3C87_366080 [compost metagenome]
MRATPDSNSTSASAKRFDRHSSASRTRSGKPRRHARESGEAQAHASATDRLCLGHRGRRPAGPDHRRRRRRPHVPSLGFGPRTGDQLRRRQEDQPLWPHQCRGPEGRPVRRFHPEPCNGHRCERRLAGGDQRPRRLVLLAPADAPLPCNRDQRRPDPRHPPPSAGAPNRAGRPAGHLCRHRQVQRQRRTDGRLLQGVRPLVADRRRRNSTQGRQEGQRQRLQPEPQGRPPAAQGRHRQEPRGPARQPACRRGARRTDLRFIGLFSGQTLLGRRRGQRRDCQRRGQDRRLHPPFGQGPLRQGRRAHRRLCRLLRFRSAVALRRADRPHRPLRLRHHNRQDARGLPGRGLDPERRQYPVEGSGPDPPQGPHRPGRGQPGDHHTLAHTTGRVQPGRGRHICRSLQGRRRDLDVARLRQSSERRSGQLSRGPYLRSARHRREQGPLRYHHRRPRGRRFDRRHHRRPAGADATRAAGGLAHGGRRLSAPEDRRTRSGPDPDRLGRTQHHRRFELPRQRRHHRHLAHSSRRQGLFQRSDPGGQGARPDAVDAQLRWSRVAHERRHGRTGSPAGSNPASEGRRIVARRRPGHQQQRTDRRRRAHGRQGADRGRQDAPGPGLGRPRPVRRRPRRHRRRHERRRRPDRHPGPTPRRPARGLRQGLGQRPDPDQRRPDPQLPQGRRRLGRAHRAQLRFQLRPGPRLRELLPRRSAPSPDRGGPQRRRRDGARRHRPVQQLPLQRRPDLHRTSGRLPGLRRGQRPGAPDRRRRRPERRSRRHRTQRPLRRLDLGGPQPVAQGARHAGAPALHPVRRCRRRHANPVQRHGRIFA